MYLKQFVASILLLLSIICRCQSTPKRAWDFHTATWNMQGAQSTASGSSSWTTLAGILGRGGDDTERIHVVALQETGDRPATAKRMADPDVTFLYRTDLQDTVTDEVRLFRWRTGM